MKESKLKLPYGIKDGQLIHISSVNISGLKCNCTCPSCHSPLRANMGRKIKNGKKKKDHFSHDIESNCSTGLETAIHLLAKEIFKKRKAIRIPSVFSHIPKKYGDEVILLSEVYEFDEVILEKRVDEIIPDIILRKGSTRLLVEIAVTHFVDDEKAEKIRNLGISTIEIDVSDILKEECSNEQFADHLIEGKKGKSWIYNAKHEQLKAKYLKQLEVRDAEEERAKQALEALHRLHMIPVVEGYSSKRKAFGGLVFNTKWCPFAKRINQQGTSSTTYANIVVDCHRCDRFKGYRDRNKYIVCLASQGEPQDESQDKQLDLL
jgi:hypothetical protein